MVNLQSTLQDIIDDMIDPFDDFPTGAEDQKVSDFLSLLKVYVAYHEEDRMLARQVVDTIESLNQYFSGDQS